MSKKALDPINLLTSATAPTTPTLKAGDSYFDTALNAVGIYTGATWLYFDALSIAAIATAAKTFQPASAAGIPVTIQGFASQTGNLLNILNSGGTTLAAFLASGLLVQQQPVPTAVNATATLTIAQLLTEIITAAGTVANSMTLPTGTLMDAGFNALFTNMSFDWSIINTGSSAGAVTVLAGTAHTIVGSATVAIATSARFRSVRTGVTTWVTYRLSV